MDKLDLKQDVKSIKIVYTALIIGIVTFIAVTVYINMIEGTGLLGEITDNPFSTTFLIVINILSVISIYLGIFIFNKKTKNMKSLDYSNKIIIYRSSMIIRAATIEGSAFLFIIGYLLFASIVLLAEAFVILFILIYFFPGNNRLSDEMKIELRDLKN